MFTMIVVMYVQYAGTSISINPMILPERYKDNAACEEAGQKMTPKTNPQSPVNIGIQDLRVGYICVISGTVAPPAH
jgi:hypothetical protein